MGNAHCSRLAGWVENGLEPSKKVTAHSVNNGPPKVKDRRAGFKTQSAPDDVSTQWKCSRHKPSRHIAIYFVSNKDYYDDFKEAFRALMYS